MAIEVADLKEKSHVLIDLIDNHDVLEDFYKALADYHNRDGSKDIIDDLTAARKKRLKESMQQGKSGKTIPHEVVKAEIKQWLGK